jgi:hypothetical protein
MTCRAACLSLALLPLLAGCSGDQLTRNLGLSRDSPDEFAVTTRAPLSMPPDYTLLPPRPGAPRPQEPAAQLAAEAALAPSVELNNRSGQDSPGQDALLAASGPPAPANIRQTIDAEAQRVNNNGGVGTTLAFWKKAPLPGKVIDPVKEAARLRASGVVGEQPAPEAATPAP